MPRILIPRKTTQILMDSFAFLSSNFIRLLLLFILPVVFLFFSEIFLHTGFAVFESPRHKPFALHVLQGQGEEIRINGKVPDMQKKPNTSETLIEGLPAGDRFLLETAKRINLPSVRGGGYLIRRAEIRKVTSELVNRIVKSPRTRGMTTILFVREPGWKLTTDGKPAVFEPTSNERVGAVLIKDIEKATIRIEHARRIFTGRMSRGQVDGLEFTYGVPARPMKDWVSIVFQIGSVLAIFVVSAFLLSFIYAEYFSGERVETAMAVRVFRATGVRTVATILFLVLLQLIFLVMVQSALVMGGNSGMLMIMIPLIIFLQARITPSTFIAQVEGLQPWHALARSFRLTRGASIRFFLGISVILFTLILYLNLAEMITAALMGMGRGAVAEDMTRMIGDRLYIWPEASLIFRGTISLLTVTLLPAAMHFLYNLYFDTRIRKEGLEDRDATALLGSGE